MTLPHFTLPMEIWSMVFDDFGVDDIFRLFIHDNGSSDNTKQGTFNSAVCYTLSKKVIIPTLYDRYLSTQYSIDTTTVEGMLQLYSINRCAVCKLAKGEWGLCNKCYNTKRVQTSFADVTTVPCECHYTDDYYNDKLDTNMHSSGSGSSISPFEITKIADHFTFRQFQENPYFPNDSDYEISVTTTYWKDDSTQTITNRIIEIWCEMSGETSTYWHTTKFPNTIVQLYPNSSLRSSQILADHWGGKMPAICLLDDLLNGSPAETAWSTDSPHWQDLNDNRFEVEW